MLTARKSLGQHFLFDPSITARIASLAGPLTGRNVLEIGPGPGGLTRALLASDAASITAIELDARAIAGLDALSATTGDRLRVIEADATETDLAALVAPPRVIVANLPYNVATPLLVSWLRTAAAFERMALMFQLEVAERIVAAPGTPAYGRLSVLAAFTCEASLVMRLPPGAFRPPPKVSSAVVRLVPLATQPAPELLAAMERVTAAAFGQRRKMLRGSLRSLGGEALLERAGIAGDLRAETLDVAAFERLARLIG